MGIYLNLVGREAIKKLYPDDSCVLQSVAIERAISAITILLDIVYSDGIAIGKKYLKDPGVTISGGRYHTILKGYYGNGNLPVNWPPDMDHFYQLYNSPLYSFQLER